MIDIIKKLKEKDKKSREIISAHSINISQNQKSISKLEEQILKLREKVSEHERNIKESKKMIFLHEKEISKREKLEELIQNNPSSMAVSMLRTELKKVGIRKIEAEESKKRGPKPKHLFMDENESKDKALTKTWASIFEVYLRKHKALNKEVNCSGNNYVNKSFAIFYRIWIERNLVSSKPNGNACFHFLQEDCTLNMVVSEKSYSDFIKKLINDIEKYNFSQIELDVEDFLHKGNY